MSALSQLIPWQPSVTVVVVTLFFAVLYFRGSSRHHLACWRRVMFWIGLVLLYGALHTRMDYYAEREFFMHRIQHVLLHHLGPFLIALSAPGPVLWAGLPDTWKKRWAEPWLASWPVRTFFSVIMNPLISATVFVLLIWMWLIPTIHFYAMLDVTLYRIMNWSVTIDGLFFWFLVLDQRRSPPARLKPAVRVILAASVIPPQMVSGAFVTLATSNLYPLYELCGRAFAGISSQEDQVYGGLILWISGTMMSVIGALLALYFWYNSEEGSEAKQASELAKKHPLDGAR